jgi:hypothetical protein
MPSHATLLLLAVFTTSLHCAQPDTQPAKPQQQQSRLVAMLSAVKKRVIDAWHYFSCTGKIGVTVLAAGALYTRSRQDNSSETKRRNQLIKNKATGEDKSNFDENHMEISSDSLFLKILPRTQTPIYVEGYTSRNNKRFAFVKNLGKKNFGTHKQDFLHKLRDVQTFFRSSRHKYPSRYAYIENFTSKNDESILADVCIHKESTSAYLDLTTKILWNERMYHYVEHNHALPSQAFYRYVMNFDLVRERASYP